MVEPEEVTTSVYGVCVVVRGEGERSDGYLKTLVVHKLGVVELEDRH